MALLESGNTDDISTTLDAIEVTCPYCEKSFLLSASNLQGVKTCPYCNQEFTIEA